MKILTRLKHNFTRLGLQEKWLGRTLIIIGLLNLIILLFHCLDFQHWSNNSLAPGRCGCNFKTIFYKPNIPYISLGTAWVIVLRLMLQNLFNEKSTLIQVIGLSTHPGTGVDGASGRGWKLADFLLKHVLFSSLLFKSYGENPIEISRMPRRGHITYRCKIWSDLFLRNKSYRLLKLLVSSNDL